MSAEERHDGEEPAQKQYDRSVDHARVRGGHGRSEAVKASMSPRRPSPAAACTVRGASDGLRCNRHWRCKHPAGARRHASLRAHADKVRLLLMKPSRQFPNRRTGKGAETSAGLTLTCVCCYHTPAAQPGLRTSRRSTDRRPPARDRTERIEKIEILFVLVSPGSGAGVCAFSRIACCDCCPQDGIPERPDA